MKNKWIILVSACLAISAIDAAAMVCSPNNFGPHNGPSMPGYGNPGYPMPYGAPQMQYGNPGHSAPYGAPYGNFGYGAPMQHNGMMPPPPPGMMIQQPGNVMMQQQNMMAQASAGGKCTCQKTGTLPGGIQQGSVLSPQGTILPNGTQQGSSLSPQGTIIENGVVKVYGSPSTATNTSGGATAKNPGVKVIYDERANEDVILVRPRNISAEQKSELERQITGAPSSSNASFNSAISEMTSFSGSGIAKSN